jgi:hypothetical protein
LKHETLNISHPLTSLSPSHILFLEIHPITQHRNNAQLCCLTNRILKRIVQ